MVLDGENLNYQNKKCICYYIEVTRNSQGKVLHSTRMIDTSDDSHYAGMRRWKLFWGIIHRISFCFEHQFFAMPKLALCATCQINGNYFDHAMGGWATVTKGGHRKRNHSSLDMPPQPNEPEAAVKICIRDATVYSGFKNNYLPLHVGRNFSHHLRSRKHSTDNQTKKTNI